LGWIRGQIPPKNEFQRGLFHKMGIAKICFENWQRNGITWKNLPTLTYGPRIIEYWTILWFNWIKSKVKLLRKLWCTFGIIGECSMNRITWKWFHSFVDLRCRKYWILNNFVIRNPMKFEIQTMAQTTWVFLLRKVVYLFDRNLPHNGALHFIIGTIWKPLISVVHWGGFIIFRCLDLRMV
jgi:hypothetical protein